MGKKSQAQVIVETWLDGLSDEHRDCVIQAQNWGAGLDRAAPCLVEQVYGDRFFVPDYEYTAVGGSFDFLSGLWGLDATVRFVKERAARPNRVTLPEPAPSPESAVVEL